MFKRLVGIYSDLVGSGRSAIARLFQGRRGEPPVRGTREMLEVYETSPWVRAVHGRIGTSIGETRWTLTRGDNDEPIDRHIMLDGLRKPNPLMSGADLMKITSIYIDLVGDAFWLKVRNGFGAPVQYLPIPPYWIIETPTPELPTFRISYGSLQEVVAESAILWFHEAAPANPYRRGTGMVRAVADEIETHEYASKHAKQLFFNRATPEFVVMDPGASEPELALHERQFLQRLQGFWRWMKPYFVNRKLEFWQPQQMNLENLTLVPLMKHDRDVLLQTVGMPPEQLGIVESSNRATADASDYIYEKRIVQPRREFIAQTLTLKLAPEFDERIVVGFESTVPADRAHGLAVAKANPAAFTFDEWRESAGLKAEGGELGKARLVPMNYYVTMDPLDATTRPQTGAATAPGDGDGKEDPEDGDAPKPEPKPKPKPKAQEAIA